MHLRPQIVDSEIVLGIDFGSSNCSVSYYKDGLVQGLSIDKDSTVKTCPTGVYIDKKTDILRVSKTQKELNYSEDYFYVTRLKERLVTRDPVIYKDCELKLQYLISEIFLNLKRELELKVGRTVSKAVLTVPAYFGEVPRHILKDAAKLADLEVLRIINEPTAAAIWYSSVKQNVEATCLFLDVGGLTIDLSICNIVSGFIDVISTYGNTSSGHQLIDLKIYEKLLSQIKTQNQKIHRLISDREGLDPQLLDFSEQLKKDFSDVPSSEIYFKKKYLCGGSEEDLHFKFSKKELFSCYTEFLIQLKELYHKVLGLSGLTQRDINKVVLIGGPTTSTLLRKLIREVIPIELEPYFNNISSVSNGAALYGSQLMGKSTERVLSDVLPISIGVELENGVVEKLLPANTKLPSCIIKQFTTTEDFQSIVKIRLVEGERLLADQCTRLGDISLSDIELALRGVPVIKVILEVTEEGVINAYVVDQKTKKNAKLKISAATRISELEVLKLRSDALKYRESDLQFINLLNLGSQIRRIYRTLKSLHGRLKDPTFLEKYYVLESKMKRTLDFHYKNPSMLGALKQELETLLRKINLHLREDSGIQKLK